MSYVAITIRSCYYEISGCIMEKENLPLYFIIEGHFSRFHWLVPLQRKYPSHVAPHLDETFSMHEPPDRLQSDSGGEFKKEVIKIAKIISFTLIAIARFE